MKTLTEIKNDQNNYGKNGLKSNRKIMLAVYNEIYNRIGSTFKLQEGYEIFLEGLTDVNEYQMKQEFSSRMCREDNAVLIQKVAPATYTFTDKFFEMIGEIESCENEIIDAYIPSSDAGYVYLIREPQSGAVKIGLTTKTPEARLKQLNSTGVLFDLELITSVYVNDCAGLESKMHNIFADARVRPDREFFMVDESVAIDTLFTEAKCFM